MTFKMKNMAYWKANNTTSPIKDTEEEAGKKHQHPHTQEEQYAIERKKGVIEDKINLTAAQNKAIAKQKALYDAGKITKKQFESDKEEISKYVDY